MALSWERAGAAFLQLVELPLFTWNTVLRCLSCVSPGAEPLVFSRSEQWRGLKPCLPLGGSALVLERGDAGSLTTNLLWSQICYASSEKAPHIEVYRWFWQKLLILGIGVGSTQHCHT